MAYLDYASGESVPGHDAREGIRELLSWLRGEPVGLDEIDTAGDAPLEEAGGDAAGDVLLESEVLGDFQLLGELGRGGMGVVYKARQLSMNRTVALKVLPSLLTGAEVALERFKREIAALGRCDHPNVVKVLTSGLAGDHNFYAMEYVDGADLARVFRLLAAWSSSANLRESDLPAAVVSASGLERNEARITGVLAPALDVDVPRPSGKGGTGRQIYYKLAELFADAASGLAALHEAGVVHRDIKPSNLMLTADGRRIVLMDLGRGCGTPRRRSPAVTSRSWAR